MTQLFVPPPLDGERLLRAIAHVESGGGVNNCPRFEIAYMPKGERFTVQGRVLTGTGASFTAIAASRWKLWGLCSAASYSRWQILYQTAADMGFTDAPWMLWDDNVAREFIVRRINRATKRGALTLAQFADEWNSGNYRDSIVPHGYVGDVSAAYAALG